MAIVELTDGLRFVPRADWGAASKYPRLGNKVARSLRTHVFTHHTVAVDGDDYTKNIWERDAEIFANMRLLQTIRGRDLGYDVPYSFVLYITPDGLTVCEGRGEDRTGAHSRGHNTRAIGCSFGGDFENQATNPVMLSNAMQHYSHFLGWLKHSASHPGYGNYAPMANLGTRQPSAARRVFVHQDIKATACPGKQLIDAVRSVDFIWPPSEQCPA